MLNPIIPGFNPDPSISAADGQYYVITSSFQWWPGLPVYRSTDLRHWELITYILKDPDWPDLRRVGDSAGVWAPCLTRSDGLWWVVFSVVNGSRYHHYECRNFLTTSESIFGPWSTPVFLNATGNDASLFHDDDGRKWLVNTHQERTGKRQGHRGALLQEYSPADQKLVGPAFEVFAGTDLGTPEGCKIHKRNGFYHLVVAEGGTFYGHAMTMARSRSIQGPYEVHPANPILTARETADHLIQRAGHGDLLTLDDDRVAVVFLASRPVDRRSHLGRETFILCGRWGDDDWLHLESKLPPVELPDFGLQEESLPPEPERDDFNEQTPAIHWNGLRKPYDDLVDLRSRPGSLCLKPTPSFFDSFENPAILVRRVRSHSYEAATLMEYAPTGEQQLAGLILYYDTRRFYVLCRQLNSEGRQEVALYGKGADASSRARLLASCPSPESPGIILGVRMDGRRLHFYYSEDEEAPSQPVGDPCDGLLLSDEQAEDHDPVHTYGFTGAFVGVAAYDIRGGGPIPAFDWFELNESGAQSALHQSVADSFARE